MGSMLINTFKGEDGKFWTLTYHTKEDPRVPKHYCIRGYTEDRKDNTEVFIPERVIGKFFPGETMA